MKDYDFSVSLKIRHPTIDPAELTRELGLEPQYSWKAGDRRPASTEGASEGTYRETYWIAPLGPIPHVSMPKLDLTLEHTLLFGALHLERTKQFWKRISAEAGTAEFIVEIFGRDSFTLELSRSTLSMLARCGLAVSVNVHSELRAVA